MLRFRLLALVLTAAVVAGNLSNAGYRCTALCSATGTFCVNQNALAAPVRGGVNFAATPSPTVTRTNCAELTDTSAGITGKVTRCTALGQTQAGIDMSVPVPVPSNTIPVPQYTVAFWMKPSLLGNNFRFLNISSKAPNEPRHEILLYRHNGKLALRTSIGTTWTAEALDGADIPWVNDYWMHITVAIHQTPIGNNRAVTVFFNGTQTLQITRLLPDPVFIMRPSTTISIAKPGPGTAAGESGAHGNSVFDIADFMVLAFAPNGWQMPPEFPLNLWARRSSIPQYSTAAVAWAGYVFHSVALPSHACGPCPCMSGTVGTPCVTTDTGYTCNVRP